MPRDKYDVETDIVKITGSYSGGVCVKCEKTMKQGSEKVICSYDIHWNCYDADANPRKDYLMYLFNEYERITK